MACDIVTWYVINDSDMTVGIHSVNPPPSMVVHIGGRGVAYKGGISTAFH